MSELPEPHTFDLRLALAVQDMASVTKSKKADTGKYTYTYADLNDVLATVKESLAKHQLTFVQTIESLNDGFAQVITSILDADTDDGAIGPSREGINNFEGMIFKVMQDPQATGSAITYARRYSLTTLFALETPDDDGQQANRAVTRPNQRTEAEKKVRDIIAALPDAMAKEDFQAAFIAEFGCGLANLSESKHGDALTWATQWRGSQS